MESVLTVGMWFLSLFAIIAILGGAAWAVTRGREPIPKMVTVGGVAMFVVTLILSSFTIVGTRQIGVATAFNKPTGQTFGNGLHIVAPWVQVHEMDGAVQIDTYQGDNRISVRLGNNSTALADASIRWEIKQEAASNLFVQYKTFEGVKQNLIERNLKVALNEAFASFDPLATKNLEVSPLPAISETALKLLRDKVGEEVEILDVSVPTIEYDPKTEERINQINEERANTTKATQEVQTNEQKRLAAEKLAGMAPPDLRIAIANCLNKMADTGQNLNCFPIGSGVTPFLEIPNPGAPRP